MEDNIVLENEQVKSGCCCCWDWQIEKKDCNKWFFFYLKQTNKIKIMMFRAFFYVELRFGWEFLSIN